MAPDNDTSRVSNGRCVRRRANALALILAVLAQLATGGRSDLSGQDSHYWSEQYGTRAALLGGALIGSVRDLSAVYYNPGALALHADAGFLLSARAHRSSTLTLVNAAGEGSDLTSSSSRPTATFAATPIEFGFLGKHVLVYSILSRQQLGIDVSTYEITQADLFQTPGTEDIAAAYHGSASLRETWTGLAWSYPITARLGIGVAPYLAIRSQELRSNLLIQTATEGGDVAIGTRLRSRSYKHTRLLSRIGVTFEDGDLSLGVTATTPSVSLSGHGFSAFNGAAASSENSGTIVGDPLLVSNVQSDLGSDFRSHWTVGAGLGWTFHRTRLHASTEWFQGTARFTALETEPIVAQAGTSSVNNDLTVEYRSVVDWGVGIEQGVGGVGLFASVATDNSAGAPDAPRSTDVTLTRYDLTRVGAGASFRLGRADFMLGLGWASGTSPFYQVFDVGNLDPDFDVDALQETDLKLTEWSVVFGFEWRPRGADNRP